MATAQAILWTDAVAVPRTENILELMGESIQPIGIGGPRIAQVDQLAHRWKCPFEDDFRKLLVDWPAKFILLGSVTGVGPEDVQTAISQGSIILTSEPLASELGELIPSKSRDSAGLPGQGRIVSTPAFIRSPWWATTIEPDQALDRPELISFESFGLPEDCSLFARLYDAWQVVLTIGQMPEEIDASLTGPLGNVPENLRGMTGHLGAHARLMNGCSAVLSLSDRAGQSGRVAHMVSNQGHLHVSDCGYHQYNKSGDPIDHAIRREQTPSFAELVASDWQYLIRRHPTGWNTLAQTPLTTDANVLSCCLACLLSARTGHPESPGKLLQLHRY